MYKWIILGFSKYGMKHKRRRDDGLWNNDFSGL